MTRAAFEKREKSFGPDGKQPARILLKCLLTTL